jgi:hypothetical protein
MPSRLLSFWRRWPQLGDQPQDVVEHLSRHRDLSHLEDDVAAVAYHLCADFDQLLPQTRQLPGLRRLGNRQGSHEIAKIVGQRMELKRFTVGLPVFLRHTALMALTSAVETASTDLKKFTEASFNQER